MSSLFADSHYFFAILNPRDAAHRQAVELSRIHRGPLVTTAWVLTEVADGLASTAQRSVFCTLIQNLKSHKTNRIIPASAEIFEQGVDLYCTRLDKQWSLTDCISFVVMSSSHITAALTGDRHFEQAGFKALLKHE